jgi:hypothetical protein
LINLSDKLIQVEFANHYFYKLTKSNKINLDILVKYLVNFIVKKYNVYKLINTHYPELKNTTNTQNNIYQNKSYEYKIFESINFNNNVVNCIRCRMIFYYRSNSNIYNNNYGYGTYSIDTKLFLNNYNLELYHKEYDFENVSTDEQKKKLICMLIFLQTTTYQIKLYFYNKKNSVVTSLYLFNQVELFKNNNDFNSQIDINSLNNTYTNEYLKFNIFINREYYILFLYGDANSPLNTTNFDELIFVHNNFTFKIFKIETPNGNQFENKILFYICFQSLLELNIFMKYINTGKMETNYDGEISNYFNIAKSITFYNYYDLNNFWIINDESITNRYEINFSINNLYINQIYLYGDLSIEFS